MGKKQHQKDKLYITCTEWSTLYGGKKTNSEVGQRAKFRRLPFSCCSLSLQPFEHPYCTNDGVVFDLMSIVPFLKKYGINPVTGAKLSAKELIKLNFHKSSAGKYHCPVTFRVFNENTHIVAVRQTGNVYAYEAVERLNIKPGFWKDLMTDEPFTRKDLITIQDPTKLEKFNLADFYHMKKNLKLLDEDEEAAKKDPRYHLKSVNAETKDILDELDRDYKAPEKKAAIKRTADSINAAHYSTGMVAAGFTSTAMDPQTQHESAVIDEDIIRYTRIKKKTYIKLITNYGALNLELHSDMVPKTCENFLKHCQNGYYNGTVFHRSIRNFMIQGGDPTGTGRGGESVWGEPFRDEFKPNLSHTGRGVLSMANSGPDTNKSQFFFTFRSCKHLDGKHTVFGRIVGGIDILDKMEAVETDKTDKPKKEMTVEATQVFVNPYEEVDEQLVKEREEAKKTEEAAKLAASRPRVTKPIDTGPRTFKEGVGKYINPVVKKQDLADAVTTGPPRKKSKAKEGFDNFSAW